MGTHGKVPPRLDRARGPTSFAAALLGCRLTRSGTGAESCLRNCRRHRLDLSARKAPEAGRTGVDGASTGGDHGLDQVVAPGAGTNYAGLVSGRSSHLFRGNSLKALKDRFLPLHAHGRLYLAWLPKRKCEVRRNHAGHLDSGRLPALWTKAALSADGHLPGFSFLQVEPETGRLGKAHRWVR